MRILAFSSLILLLFIVSSCEECGECMSPPAPFTFELIGATSNENLFDNGTFSSSALSIKDRLSNRTIDYEIITESGRSLIHTNDIGWQTETVDLIFSVSDRELFTFYVVAENVTEDCCNFTRYKELNLEGAEFAILSTTGVYQVLID